jgi:hypothetical protein
VKYSIIAVICKQYKLVLDNVLHFALRRCDTEQWPQLDGTLFLKMWTVYVPGDKEKFLKFEHNVTPNIWQYHKMSHKVKQSYKAYRRKNLIISIPEIFLSFNVYWKICEWKIIFFDFKYQLFQGVIFLHKNNRKTFSYITVEISAFYTPNPLSCIFKNIILNKHLVTR